MTDTSKKVTRKNVLVFGSNGYIGYNVSVALRRAGYNVFGFVRSLAKGIELAKQEIVPVVGDVDDLKSLDAYLVKSDIVIDCIERDKKNGMGANEAIMKAVIQASKVAGVKKTYVYTSGCMDYGNHPGKEIDETAACKQDLLKSRIDFCNAVLASDEINGIVVRPAWVYGGWFGTYVNSWFKTSGDIEVKGNPDKTWPWIHIFDLAEFYVLLLKNPKSVGQIFDVSDSTRITDKDARVAYARAAGNKDGKVKMLDVEAGAWGVISETSMTTTSKKARTMLGWEPKFVPMQDELAEGYSAYLAWAQSTK
jgi:nucleoside-diphosphate-sugar epimerase